MPFTLKMIMQKKMKVTRANQPRNEALSVIFTQFGVKINGFINESKISCLI